jgi:hypothetical protein
MKYNEISNVLEDKSAESENDDLKKILIKDCMPYITNHKTDILKNVF